MQTDMHYYGTFAMARAAGFSVESAGIIATAAQFVDDAAEKETVEFEDGARLDLEATAHHTASLRNISAEDQRKVWVPFHFMPGNEGETYEERLVCRMDSLLAREMVDRNLGRSDAPYYLPLLGITAHVYADTFSHYGFSGVSSFINRVLNNSFAFHGLDPVVADYITNKAQKFVSKHREEIGVAQRAMTWFGETLSGALGHGSVATFPDRPYLRWSFQYQADGTEVVRDNPATFLAGCKALHETFRRAADRRPDLTSDRGRDWSSIEERVAEVLLTQAPMDGRVAAWQAAAQAGDLFVAREPIPVYDAEDWHSQREALDGTADSRAALKTDVYRFYQAASSHRTHVIRELLPSHGLLVG